MRWECKDGRFGRIAGRLVLAAMLGMISVQVLGVNVAHASPGDLDVTFGIGGKVTTRFGDDPVWSSAMLVQPDGRLIVAGYQGPMSARDFLVARLLEDGTLDSSFGTAGATMVDFGGEDLARAVALQADGRIVVAGTTSVGLDFAVARLRPNGSLDRSFGTGGMVTTHMGSNDTARQVLVLPSGGILVGGNAGTTRLALARYTTNGVLDAGFDGDGKVTTPMGSTGVAGYDALVQGDGSIVLGGTVADDLVLARYRPDGSLDNSFGSGGKTVTDLGLEEAIRSLALQDDGDILAAVSISSGPGSVEAAVARYETNGALDASFGANGIAPADGVSTIWAMLVRQDGHFLVGGNTDGDFSLLQFMPDGTADDTFGVGGVVTVDFGATDIVKDLAFQADEKIVATGYSGTDADGFSFALTRHLSEDDPPGGSLDASFGSGGLVTTEMQGGPDGWGTAVAIHLNGQIIEVGAQGIAPTRNLATVRYNPDGSVDAGFGTAGQAITDLGRDELARDVAIQADGKIVVVGHSSADVLVARYLANGQPDTTFGAGGAVVTDLGGVDGWRGVAVQADGKIVAAGFVDERDFALARYLSNGALDQTFGAGGIATTDVNGDEDWVFGIALQADGKIVAAGYAGSDVAVARYSTNGSLDATYAGDGTVTTDFGAIDVASAVAIQADGKAVIAGYSGIGGDQHIILARYQGNGGPDLSFGGTGTVFTDLPGGGEKARSLAIQVDGRIVAAGYQIAGESKMREFSLTRYLPDGALDGSFGTGGTVSTDFSGNSDDWIHDVAIQVDGRIVAVGNTGTGEVGTYSFALARYLP